MVRAQHRIITVHYRGVKNPQLDFNFDSEGPVYRIKWDLGAEIKYNLYNYVLICS